MPKSISSVSQSAAIATITVVGRKTGKEISLPVQFVDEEDRILLLPFMGKDTNWYLNLTKNPSITVSIGGKNYRGKASLSTAPQRLKVVIEKFVAKYGDKNIASYYPKKNAYVEVPTRRASRIKS